MTGAEQAYFNPSTLSQYAALSVSNASDITASNLVDFLRGNRGLEQDGDVSHAQIWRRRSHVLGDIVNTQPIFMKAPNAAYTDTGYSTFKAANASRKPLVFVSAQDGMLHAFNAHTDAVTVSGTAVQPGEEMWAFIPSQAMESMKLLGDVSYAHRYFVDGSPKVADVKVGGVLLFGDACGFRRRCGARLADGVASGDQKLAVRRHGEAMGGGQTADPADDRIAGGIDDGCGIFTTERNVDRAVGESRVGRGQQRAGQNQSR